MPNENKVLQTLCQEILRCVEKKIESAGFDKTYKVRILRYDSIKQAYIVSLNNSEAIVKNSSNNTIMRHHYGVNDTKFICPFEKKRLPLHADNI